jgi:hypothetical protein
MWMFDLVRRLRMGAILAGGGAALLGVGIANADDTTVDVNGWTVETNGGALSSATLLDPSDSLGTGTQVVGSFDSVPYPFDHSESVQIFDSGPTGSETPPFIDIRNEWLSPSLLESTLNGNDGTTGGVTQGFFETNLGGNEVVDLYNAPDAYVPLVNPDATGPIDVGGVALASPQDGALFNDIFDALFNGDTADWGNAATLFGDLFSL